jgi:hypothetical protein
VRSSIMPRSRLCTAVLTPTMFRRDNAVATTDRPTEGVGHLYLLLLLTARARPVRACKAWRGGGIVVVEWFQARGASIDLDAWLFNRERSTAD